MHFNKYTLFFSWTPGLKHINNKAWRYAKSRASSMYSVLYNLFKTYPGVKIMVFWDVMACSLVGWYERSRGI
jgi:hypothetical protein